MRFKGVEILPFLLLLLFKMHYDNLYKSSFNPRIREAIMKEAKVKIKTSWLRYWLGYIGICPGKTPEGMDFMIWINECLEEEKELFLCLTDMQLFNCFSSLLIPRLIEILKE